MTKHIFVQRGGDRYVCGYCDRSFNSMKLTQVHEKVKHGDSGTIKCYKCDEKFRDTRAYETHFSRMHPRRVSNGWQKDSDQRYVKY